MFRKVLMLTVVVLVAEACEVQAGIVDSYEPDDDYTIAGEIQPNSPQTHSIVPATDVDWVFFQLSEESEVVIETSGASGDTRMWLYDNTLTELQYDDDGGNGRFSRIERSGCRGGGALPAGRYYVKVDEYGNNDEIANYDITLTVTSCTEQIISHWVGGDGDQWGNPSSWDPPIVPENNASQTFAVTISTAERIRVEFNHDSTIDQLDCYGNVDLEVGENYLCLVAPNGLTNHGKLGISGRGVEHEIMGNVTNTSNAHIKLTNIIEFHGTFTNNGQVFVVPGAQFYIKSGSFINSGKFLIYNGFVVAQNDDLENSDTGVIEGFGVIHSDLPIRNQGNIYAYGGSLAVSCEGPLLNSGVLANYPLSSLHIKPAEDVNNLGLIEVNAGGGVAFDCNLVNKPNGIIKLLGGTLAATSITQSAGATFEGFGGITGNVVIDPNGIIKLTGPTNIVGDVTVEHNAVLEISNGQTLIVGHTTNNGVIHVINGDVVFQGGYSGSGLVQKD